jgi:ankyrin repeat protein
MPQRLHALLGESQLQMNAQTPGRWALLHFAAAFAHPDCVTVLLANGANGNLSTETGQTPLQLAAVRGCDQTIAALLPRSDVYARDATGRTALHYAVEHQNATSVELLISEAARKFGDTRWFINSATHSGETPLHLALNTHNIELENENGTYQSGPFSGHGARRVTAKAKKIVECLVRKKADLNARDVEGNTPLSLTLESHHPQAIELAVALVRNGASVSEPDPNGHSPLHLAALSQAPNAPDLVAELLQRHADPNAGDRDGITPLHCAASAGNEKSLQMLLTAGANPLACDISGNSAESYVESQCGGVLRCRALLQAAANYERGKPFNILLPVSPSDTGTSFPEQPSATPSADGAYVRESKPAVHSLGVTMRQR